MSKLDPMARALLDLLIDDVVDLLVRDTGELAGHWHWQEEEHKAVRLQVVKMVCHSINNAVDTLKEAANLAPGPDTLAMDMIAKLLNGGFGPPTLEALVSIVETSGRKITARYGKGETHE